MAATADPLVSLRLSRLVTEPGASEGLDLEWLRQQRIAPLRRGTEDIVIAMERPQDVEAVRAVQRTTRRRPVPIAATAEEIDELLDQAYGRPVDTAGLMAR